MKRSQLTSIIREEILTLVNDKPIKEIERGENEISAVDRGNIERHAIKKIAKAKFGDKWKYGRHQNEAGRDFFRHEPEEQKKLLQQALKDLQDQGKIDPNKVYTAGTFYEDVVDVDDKESHKAATIGTGGKEAKEFEKETTAGLKADKKRGLMKKFIQHMKDIDAIGPDGKLLDAKEYKTQFAKYNKNRAEYIEYFTDY